MHEKLGPQATRMRILDLPQVESMDAHERHDFGEKLNSQSDIDLQGILEQMQEDPSFIPKL